MEQVLFIFTLAATILLFYRAANKSKAVLAVIFLWMILQGVLVFTGFFTTYSLPPRMLAMLAPPVLFIIYLLISKRGRAFMDSMNIKMLTLLHVIRIPVEIVLLWLWIDKLVPRIMTFEGRNFDILSGISAPLVYYFANKRAMLIWNLICLLLLVNIVTIAILSTPYPFQEFGLDQPNIAIFQLPYNWLASVIVPIVLFAHVASLRQLLRPQILHRISQRRLNSLEANSNKSNHQSHQPRQRKQPPANINPVSKVL